MVNRKEEDGGKGKGGEKEKAEEEEKEMGWRGKRRKGKR